MSNITTDGDNDYFLYDTIIKNNQIFKTIYTLNLDIIIECYDIIEKELYQRKFTKFNLENYFDDYNDEYIKVYEKILSALNSDNFRIIQKTNDKEIDLELNFNDMYKILTLNKIKTYVIKEYIDIKEKDIYNLKIENKNLNNQIKELKIKNEELNNYINDINKKNNNKSIKISNLSSINEYIDTFELSDINANTKMLDICFKSGGNEILQNISDLNFNDLEELKLYHNKISDINPLKNMKLENLHSLHLYHNLITDISALQGCNLEQLQNLSLQYNNIRDISPLAKLNCIQLKILHLDNNQIVDISPLSKVKFCDLEILTLHKNKIKNILVFQEVLFKKLKKLSLHYNDITDISILEKYRFLELESLWLYKNKFSYENNEKTIKILKETYPDFL